MTLLNGPGKGKGLPYFFSYIEYSIWYIFNCIPFYLD